MKKNKLDKQKVATDKIFQTMPQKSFFDELRFGFHDKKKWWPLIAAFVFGLFCLFYFPIIATDFAISGDEIIDDTHSTYVLNYFKNGDPTALNQPQTKLHLYGSEIQVVIKSLSDAFGVEDCYAFRHICCALLAVWCICLAGLLAYRFGGGLCGLLAMILLFFTPRFFGHAINNLKDLPFATGYLATIYYFIRFFDFYPQIKLRYLLGTLAGIFLCLGTRSGGLMLYPMLFMYAGLYYIRRFGILGAFNLKKHFLDFVKILCIVLGVLLIGYTISILLWPWALKDPLHAVVKSLHQFTNINTGIKTIFEGKQVMSNMLPTWYAPKFFAIATPLVVLLGLFGSIILFFVKRQKFNLDIFFILFCLFAPLAYIVYKHSNLYGGIRHLLFITPLMAIVAAIFWSDLMSYQKKWLNIVTGILFLILLALPIRHYIQNHPYEYVYFNELVGGFKGAYSDYESDYYFNSLKSSADFIKQDPQVMKGKPAIVVTNHSAIMQHYFRNYPNIKVIYSKYYAKYSKDWDFGAFSNVYISQYQQRNGLFPPENTILCQEVDGKAIGCLIKRDDKRELEGFQLMNTDRLKAAQIFEKYIVQHPKNEEVYCALVKIYYLLNDFQAVEFYAQKAIELMPNYSEVLFYLSYSQIKQKQFDTAEQNIKLILEENELSADAIFLRANIKVSKGELQNALKDLDFVVSRKPQNIDAYQLGMTILGYLGNWENAEHVGKNALKINERNTKTLVMIANAVCHQGRYNEAEQWLARAMKFQPTYYEIYKVRARICIERGELNEAESMLSMLNDINTDSDLFTIRALYFSKIGNPTDAFYMAQKALSLDSNNAEVKEFIANLN